MGLVTYLAVRKTKLLAASICCLALQARINTSQGKVGSGVTVDLPTFEPALDRDTSWNCVCHIQHRDERRSLNSEKTYCCHHGRPVVVAAVG